MAPQALKSVTESANQALRWTVVGVLRGAAAGPMADSIYAHSLAAVQPEQVAIVAASEQQVRTGSESSKLF